MDDKPTMPRLARVAFVAIGSMFTLFSIGVARQHRDIGLPLAAMVTVALGGAAFLLIGFGLFGYGRWRFTMKAFLIGMTVVAFVLGLLGCAIRN